MIVLLTGASGFIGSHIARELSREKAAVIIAPVRQTAKYKNRDFLSATNIMLKEGLFYDRNFLDFLFKKYAIEYVVHTAALRGSSKGSIQDYDNINVYGTEILLDYARRNNVKRFIYCSSIGVWGTIPNHNPPDNTTELVGDTLYHRSKIAAEKKIQNYIRDGYDAIIVRPTITYGVGDDGFPCRLISLIRSRRIIMPKTDIRMHLVSVERLAQLFVALLTVEKLHTTIILGVDKEPISLRKLVDMIHRHFYCKPYPQYLYAPNTLFALAKSVSKVIKSDVWTTRFRLLTENWWYKAQDLSHELHFSASNTEQEFKMYLESIS